MIPFRRKVTRTLIYLWILCNFKAVQCEDDDDAASSSATAVIPKFTSRPQSFRVVIGDTVRLPCQVDTLGPYVLIWKRGPSVLSAGSMRISQDKRLTLVNGFDLQISRVRPQDSGSWVCQLSTYNPKEQTHTLEILVPPTVRSEPSHISLSKGDSSTLKCQATGNPVPTLTWTRLNNMLPNGEQSVVANEYAISQADRHQTGIYICTANNGVGVPVSTQVEVKVQYPPEIDVERAWIHSGEGQEAVLACIVHSDPPIQKVNFLLDTMVLHTDGRRLIEQRGSRYSLIIRHLQHSDFGNYSCEAFNKLGRSSKHILLSGKPNRAIFRSDPVGRFKSSFNITWTLETFSPIDEYRLSYRRKHYNLTHDMAGPWLDVVLPAAPGETSSYLERSGAAKASVAPAQAVINWKSYHIRNLDPGVIYEAKVTARNKYGWGQPSDLFQFNTQSADKYPFESSPQHDVLSEPEVRDMRITSPSSSAPAFSPHPSFSLWILLLSPLLVIIHLLPVCCTNTITTSIPSSHSQFK